MTDTLTIYADQAGFIRWRVTAQNGETVLAASEGYSTVRDAMANAMRYLVVSPTEDPDVFHVHPVTDLADTDAIVESIVDELIEPDPEAPPSVNAARRRFTGAEVRGVLRALFSCTFKRVGVIPRCAHVSQSPWGPTQCALTAGHEDRHAYSPSEGL